MTIESTDPHDINEEVSTSAVVTLYSEVLVCELVDLYDAAFQLEGKPVPTHLIPECCTKHHEYLLKCVPVLAGHSFQETSNLDMNERLEKLRALINRLGPTVRIPRPA